MNILVSGASGFIGKALCAELARQGYTVRAAVRSAAQQVDQVENVSVGDINGDTDWTKALSDMSVVVHLAARAHITKECLVDSMEGFRKINVDGAWNLARQAHEAGVRRFVFISSIKVNGDATELGKPYTPADKPAPAGPYGISKFEAEEALRLLADETGMEVVIIRPPLVYGPGVKANFHSLMHWLHRGVPLPLAGVCNKRSFVSLDNLVDLIITCIDHPAAANQTFLAGDGEDMSTTELLQRMGAVLGRPAKLFYLPAWLLRIGALLLGRAEMLQRLCGSLQADISKANELLGWHPPVRVDDALRKTAADFLQKS